MLVVGLWMNILICGFSRFFGDGRQKHIKWIVGRRSSLVFIWMGLIYTKQPTHLSCIMFRQFISSATIHDTRSTPHTIWKMGKCTDGLLPLHQKGNKKKKPKIGCEIKASEPRIDKMPHRCLSCILAQSFRRDLFCVHACCEK